MLIRSLGISDFKGVEATIPWAGVVVLFGANDSGKTNVLEAISAYFAGTAEHVRLDPLAEERLDPPFICAKVELNGVHLRGHLDQLRVAQLLAASGGENPEDVAKALEEADEAGWDAMTVAAVVDSYRAGYKAAAMEQATERAASWSDVESDYETLLDWVLGSRQWLFDGDEVTWLPPDEISGAAAAAFGRLRDSSHWSGELGWAVRVAQQAEVGTYEPLDLFMERDGMPLLRTVDLDASRSAQRTLYDAIDTYVDAQLDERQTVKDPYWGSEEVSVAEYKRRRRPESLLHRDSWLERRDDGVSVTDLVVEICDELEERAQRIAPALISDHYEIEIRPEGPDRWRPLGGRRTTVKLRPDSGGDPFDLDVTALGIATWTRLAILEAMRDLGEGQPPEDERRRPPIVYLFDEPEAHLHPLAQAEASRWIAERSLGDVHFCIATHSPAFLQIPREDVEYVKIERDSKRQTVATRITHDVLGELRSTAESVGLHPAALLQLTRAWLVVEGEHDRLIVDRFFGSRLRSAGVWVLPLRGTRHATPSFMNLQLLGDFGLPFHVLLDNSRAGAVERGEIPESERSDEEKTVSQLIHLQQQGVNVRPLGLPYPDIVRALPYAAVMEVVADIARRASADSSWDEIDEEYAAAVAAAEANGRKAPKYKPWLLDHLGVSHVGPDRFVDHVLEVSDASQADPALRREINVVLASVD